MRYVVTIISTLAIAGCSPVETKSELVTTSKAQHLSAGPGDVVMEFKSSKPLPNAFGKADLFGRTTDAGRTSVRYIGTSGNRAIFERQDIVVDSNATTMNQTPLIIPHTSNTTINGSIGNTSVYGTARTTSYNVIGPRPTSQYITGARPIQFSLGSGQNVKIQGRTLFVLRVAPMSVDYKVN